MSARWSVLVVSSTRVAPVELPTSKPLLVGRGRAAGLDLDDPLVDERHLSLRVVNDRPVLDPLGGTSGVSVNEVPCDAPLSLSAGDEIALGSTRLLVMPVEAPGEPPIRLASEDELTARLEEESRRAGITRAVGFVLVSTAGLNVAARQALTRRVVDAVAQSGAVASWGSIADDVLGGIVPELSDGALETLFAVLPGVAGPRAVTACSRSPIDGYSGGALLEAAFARLLSLSLEPSEPVVADASMLRLHGLTATLADRPGLFAFVGRPGSGRSTLARTLFAARRLEPAVHDAETLVEPVELSAAMLVKEADALDGAAWSRLTEHAQSRRRLIAVTTQTVPAVTGRATTVIEVPALAARSLDIEALADHFLREARAALGRPRLALGADARRLLLAWQWPGQVRELRTVIFRAARAAVRDEVGSDALPARLSATGSRSTLRGALQETERDLLLEALARTRWNVTAAATRLGLPRRTVVYRMARLGLRRPARRR